MIPRELIDRTLRLLKEICDECDYFSWESKCLYEHDCEHRSVISALETEREKMRKGEAIKKQFEELLHNRKPIKGHMAEDGIFEYDDDGGRA